MRIYKVFISRDGTKPMIIVPTHTKEGIKNGQKTYSLKAGYKARYLVKGV